MSPALFFRAFDLAFFVPGSLMLMHLLYTFRANVSWETLEKAGDKTAIGIIYIAGLVVVSFVFGLLCHCITRLVYLSNKRESTHNSQKGTYQNANPNSYSGEDKGRIDYFWYLRATCWNTSVALFLMAILETFGPNFFAAFGVTRTSSTTYFYVTYVVAAFAMWFLGYDYHRAYMARIGNQRNTPVGFTQP
jgi:hypothetical protein